MSGYVAVAVDAIEPISQYVWETVANTSLYSVIDGCGLTYSASDLTVDIAVGTVKHFGSVVPVSAAVGAFTLVADPSNPRFTWLAIASDGSKVVVSGTPAVSPAVPALGDRVAVALVYVNANLTIASNASYKIDNRVPSTEVSHLYNYTSATQTISASTSFVDVIGAKTTGSSTLKFSFDAAVSGIYLCEYHLPLSFTGTGGAKFQLTGPAAPTSVIVQAQAPLYNTTTGSAYSSAEVAVSGLTTAIAAHNAAAGTDGLYSTGLLGVPLTILLVFVNGTTAGAVTLQMAQNSANGTAVIGVGGSMEVVKIG